MPVIINGSTGITGVNGSAAIPAFPGVDTDTGIFFPSNGAIGFSNDGTERMRIDSSGNVGIGTSTPRSRLDINSGVISGVGNIGGQSNSSAYSIWGGESSLNGGYIQFWGSTSAAPNILVFGNSNSGENMRITSTGNVGIGNTAPNAKLQVTGTANISSTVVVGGALTSANLTTTTNTATIGTASYFVANGNVGIGTASPGTKLDISGSSYITGSLGVGVSPSYKIDVSGSGTSIVSRGWSANNTQSVGMHFMAINNGGTGDTNVAGYTFHCSGTYATHMHLRPDGYIGMGGWSASTWRWYVNMTNGDMTAAGNVTAYSDPRLKEDITKINSPVNTVMRLNGVKFRWKESSVIGHPGKYDYGVLANEVQEVLPEIVRESCQESPDGDKYKTVDYTRIVPLLIEAIKEQQKQIEEMKLEIKELKNGNFRTT